MDVFSMRKAFLGGAAVTAVMLLVMSAAWACSPYGFQALRDPARPDDSTPLLEGPAGTAVLIRGSAYEQQYGRVTVEYGTGSDFTTELGEAVLEYERDVVLFDKRLEIDRVHSLYKFTIQVTVPAGKTSGHLYVYQRSTDGIKRSQVFNVIPPPPPPTGPPGTAAPQPTTATTVPQPQPTATTLALTPTGAITPTTADGARRGDLVPSLQPCDQRRSGDAVDGSCDARPGAAPGAVAVTVVGGRGALVGSELPIAPVAGSPGRFELAPWVDPPELDMQTLWSGLGKSEGPSAASLTGPLQPRPDDPSRLGVGLLTLGALLLLTGGLIAVPRRRRALARIR